MSVVDGAMMADGQRRVQISGRVPVTRIWFDLVAIWRMKTWVCSADRWLNWKTDYSPVWCSEVDVFAPRLAPMTCQDIHLDIGSKDRQVNRD